jgi:hypothetical protein
MLSAIVVLLVAVVATVVVEGTRVGVLGLVAVLLLAGLCRLLLPTAWAGPLAVRSRALDVATVWSLAVAMLVMLRLLPTP